MPLKITASVFSLCFPMKSEAALKVANEPSGLFVSGFTMTRVAKHNELTALPPQKITNGEKETQEEFIQC